MTKIPLVAASAGLLFATTASALAAKSVTSVQGPYNVQMTKSCLSDTGPTTVALYGKGSFTLSTRTLTLTGFEDSISPANTTAKETAIDITEAYSYTSDSLTLGPITYHAYYQALVSGVATIIAFGGIDSEGCIETGTLLR
jgi:hypothetical protein